MLVNHNLVRAEEGEGETTRYTMVETVLDYAHGRLVACGEMGAYRQAHAEVFCHFIEAAMPQVVGLERRRWIERIEQDNDNLRAALVWAQEVGAVGVLVRLAVSLGWFWELQGRRVEACGLVEIALAAHARVLHMAGFIAGCVQKGAFSFGSTHQPALSASSVVHFSALVIAQC